MRREMQWLIGGCVVLGLLAMAPSAPATGIDDFKLTRAIPADAMLVVQTRDHEGRKFVNEQFDRVWAEVEKQHFEKDLKRLLQSAIQEQGGDTAAFETHWQQITDLAAGVEWSNLSKQEFAFAMKLSPPFGVDLVVLMVPPKDRVAENFDGLVAILKSLTELAGEGMLIHSEEGTGNSVVHKLSMANMPVPLGLMLARHEDVLLIGIGSTMPEQALALLRGQAGAAGATLASTDRFKEAFKQLPPPADELFFADLAKIMAQMRVFAQMAASVNATQPAEPGAAAEAKGPLSFLVPMVDALDLWECAASVSSTDGMKTTSEAVVVLRSDAKSKPFGKVFYGGAPLREPLKYVPKEATGVSVGSGMDWQALYKAVLGFIGSEVPDGKNLLAQWDTTRQQLPFDIEKDLLSWIGSSYATFSAPIPTPFMPGSVLVLDVRDQEKAAASLALVSDLINKQFGEQGAGVEDAKLEGVEGFKQVILPPFLMMIPGLGQPLYGLKDGHLILANGPKVLALALETAAGKHESFAKNERFVQEGLPLTEGMTGFSFQDLTGWGDSIGQVLNMVGLLRGMVPDLAQNPAAGTAILMVSKAGNVFKQFNFYRSQCSVSTVDGNTLHQKSVLNYQEPPKPKARETTPETPAPGGETSPPKSDPK